MREVGSRIFCGAGMERDCPEKRNIGMLSINSMKNVLISLVKGPISRKKAIIYCRKKALEGMRLEAVDR